MLGAEQKLVQALYGLLQGADRLNVDHKIGLLTKPIRSSPDLCRDVNHHLEILCIFCSQDQWLCAVFHHLLAGEHVGVVRWHICGMSCRHEKVHVRQSIADSGRTSHVCQHAVTTLTSLQIIGVQEAVSYTHLRAHETDSYLVCRLLLE